MRRILKFDKEKPLTNFKTKSLISLALLLSASMVYAEDYTFECPTDISAQLREWDERERAWNARAWNARGSLSNGTLQKIPIHGKPQSFRLTRRVGRANNQQGVEGLMCNDAGPIVFWPIPEGNTK